MSNPPDVIEPYPGWAHENTGAKLLGAISTITGVAFLFVVARIYSRMISIRRLSIDDYLVIFSIVSATPKTYLRS
jgi:hypothetical protein